MPLRPRSAEGLRLGPRRKTGLPRSGRATLLWDRQAEAIRTQATRRHREDQYDHHPRRQRGPCAQIARRVAELGADIANCVPLYPVPGTALGNAAPPPLDRVVAIRREVGRWLPVMEHCTRCRADAVGLLGEAMPPHVELALLHAAQPKENRPCVAVATMEGVLVNQHLGEAERLAVYGRGPNGFRLIEPAPLRHPAAVAIAGWPSPRRCTTAAPCWWPVPGKRRDPFWPSRESRSSSWRD